MTIDQMRLLLGLGSDVSDADVIAAYGQYQATLADGLLTLETVRDHLRLEDDDTSQDGYLGILMLAAQRAVENHLDRNIRTALATFNNDDLVVVGQAMLLLIGNWFANREGAVVGVSASEVPLAVEWLLAPIKKWTC